MLGPLQISRETARIFLQIGKFSYAHMAVNKRLDGFEAIFVC